MIGITRDDRRYRCVGCNFERGLGVSPNGFRLTTISADWVDGSALAWLLDSERDSIEPDLGAQVWHELTAHALRAALHDNALPDWVLYRAAHLFEQYDVTVVLTASEDWKAPNLRLDIGGAVAGGFRLTSESRPLGGHDAPNEFS